MNPDREYNLDTKFYPMQPSNAPTGEYTTKPTLQIGPAEVTVYFKGGDLYVEIANGNNVIDRIVIDAGDFGA